MDRTSPASTTPNANANAYTNANANACAPRTDSRAGSRADPRAGSRTNPRTAGATTKKSPSRRRNHRRFQSDPAPPPSSDGPLQSFGPLRGATPDPAAPPARPGSQLQAGGSLRDQGVLGLQLRQQGDAAEVRLQLRQGDGVVEASLRETSRGVEIQLTAGPDQQQLLRRVAESLADQRGDHAFDLDEVNVDTHGNPAHAGHQDPGEATGAEATSVRRRRRANGPANGLASGLASGLPGSTTHPGATGVSTSYSR